MTPPHLPYLSGHANQLIIRNKKKKAWSQPDDDCILSDAAACQPRLARDLSFCSSCFMAKPMKASSQPVSACCVETTSFCDMLSEAQIEFYNTSRDIRSSPQISFSILPPPSTNAAILRVRVEEKIKSLGFCSDIYHIPCIYNITSLPSRLLQLCNSTFPTLTRSHVAAENSVIVSDRAAVSISHLRVEISTLTVEFEKSKP